MGPIGGMGCSDSKDRWPDFQGGYQIIEPRHQASPVKDKGQHKKPTTGDWISCGQCEACFYRYPELCKTKTYL